MIVEFEGNMYKVPQDMVDLCVRTQELVSEVSNGSRTTEDASEAMELMIRGTGYSVEQVEACYWLCVKEASGAPAKELSH